MPLSPFKLERYFAQYEFKARYLLSPSDCEALPMSELLAMASPASLALWQNLKLGYTESQGHPLLRAEIAGLYEHIPPENILVAVPEEAIFILMQTVLKPGDQVVAISPAYQSLHEVARSLGCSVTPWPVEPLSNGTWHLDFSHLEASLTGQTRLLVINFPHNPTGFSLSLAELETIIDLARRHDITLFSDEMYRLLEYDPSKRLPSVADLYEKGISLSGLSKSFALPGLRLGWLAAQASSLLERCQAYKDYTTICSSAPSEILGLIALQNRGRILPRNLEIIRANLKACELFFSKYPGLFHWFPPRAGSVAFPQWIGPGSVEQFCADALESCGVMIVPASMFDFPGPHFRVGLGRRNLPEALEELERFLEER